MHEMALAEGVLDIALTTAKEHDCKVIHRITLQIGEMAGVEMEAFRFAFTVLSKGTMAASAEIAVESVPLVASCLDCAYEFSVENYRFVCPKCGSHVIHTKTGRELKVTSIDMD